MNKYKHTYGNKVEDSRNVQTIGFGFVITVIYLFFEYGRPQDTFGIIGVLRPNLILTLLIVMAWIGSGRLSMAASPQTTRMLLMLVLLAIHIPFAVNNYKAYQQAYAFLLFLPFFISVILFVDELKKLRLFMKFWAWLTIYIAVNGIRGGGIAGSSFLADENDFALLMSMMLPFSLMLFVYERKLLYLFATALCVASIVVSMSRGGFLGLAATLGVIWLKSPHKGKSLLIIGVLAVVVYYVADQTYWDEMSSISNTEEGTAKGRIESWRAGWDMFKAHPFGVGGQNYTVHFDDYQSDFFRHSMWGRQAHSLWFTLLPELGIPGLLIYFSLLRLNLRDIWYMHNLSRDKESYRFAYFMSIAFAASLAGYFVAGTFLSVLYYPHYFYLTAMIVATRRIIDKDVGESQKIPVA